MAPPEILEAENQTSILTQIRNIQYAIFGMIATTNTILKDSLSFDKDIFRRNQEQARELEKEQQRISYADTGQTNITAPGEIGEGIGASITAGLGGGLGGFLGGLSGAGAMKLTKGFLGGLLRGGFFFTIGDYVGEYLGGQIDDPTVSEIVETALPLAGLGMIFGPKGALVGALAGLATVGISSVAEYLSGEKPLSEVNSVEWASIPIAGLAGAKLLNSFLSKSKIPAVARFGGIFSATPLAIAGLLALTLGVGLKWVADKIQDSKRDMLKNLSDYTDTIEQDIANNLPVGTTMAQQEEGFFENIGLGGRESDIGSISAATGQAVGDLRGGDADLGDAQRNEITETIDKLVQQTDPSVIQSYLTDYSKTNSLLSSLQNLLYLSSKGQSADPENDTRKILEYMNVISQTSEKLRSEGVKITQPAKMISQSLIMTTPDIQSNITSLEQDIVNIEKQLSLGKEDPSFEGYEGVKNVYTLQGMITQKQKQISELKQNLDNLSLSAKGGTSGVRIDIDDLIDILGTQTLLGLNIQATNTDILRNRNRFISDTSNGAPYTPPIIIQDNSNKDMSQNTSMSGQQIGSMILSAIDADVREDY